ncbi:MAG TPA: maltotransferase domain-containing protein [Nitrososphaerales archaeon]|nr:maltotransferase domain-containing protein [Nitrososphaerales archaeon]
MIEPTTLRESPLSKANNGSAGVPGEIQILNISPMIDCDRFCPKRILGDKLVVTAEILKPGHHVLVADLAWRMRGGNEWKRVEMLYSVNEDQWTATLVLNELGFLEFRIEAWEDVFSRILQDIRRWQGVDQDVTPDVETLIDFSRRASMSASPDDRDRIAETLSKLPGVGPSVSSSEISSLIDALSEKSLSSLIARNSEKKDFIASPIYTVIVDRSVARYATWYEMFHRSQGRIKGKSGTLKDCEARLGEVKEMGFDIVYLPPVHPIGITNRRGPNNTPSTSKNDPGSPWAIGNRSGGHDAINPDLGTMQDFAELVASAKNLGMEIALDLAFQVSPDHPYVREHPEWFYYQPDGTIRFAENPPKRYYDIYPLNFENVDWRSLWEELRRVVEFWIQEGVKIFRVDNPHTKPIPFWEWLIFSVRVEHPEVIFLSEAFTRPNSMKLLAKAGFDQSYTYFTWKNTKHELSEFLKEFFFSEVTEYYRPNLFTNTPDILTEYLQTGGRAAFKVRETLAATLSSSYGIYNGFELCENRAKSEHSEEYLDSEKYQYKTWDWNREGNIKDYIAKMNQIRRENPALQENSTLRLLDCEGDHIIFYGKWLSDLSNVILVAVNLDPFSTHETLVTVPVKELGLNGNYTVSDLISERDFVWNGERNYVKLDPNLESAHVLLLKGNH